MEKKNGLIISVIVVLSILVGLLGGYFLSNTLADKNQGTADTNNNVDNNGNNTQTSFTLEDAKDLMDKYVTAAHGINVCGIYYFSDLENENAKNYLALSRVEKKESISCDEAVGNNNDGNLDDCGLLWEPWVYSYEEVLNNKKELFGNNSSIAKQNIEGPSYSTYTYFKDKDAFVYTGSYGGGDCVEHEYSVNDFKIQNDNLYIYTSGKFSIGYPDEKEIKHKYTFKKQDSGYYMTAVEKIN